MTVVANILVGLTGLLHVYILYLEMFLWTKPAGMKTFNLTPERAELTKPMAANQGLYNGFLAAGLFWSLLQGDPAFAFQLKVFFLGCVIVAAAYGAYSVNRKILLTQGTPAILGMIAVLLWAHPQM
jgi:putative membrane protein